MPQVFKLGSYWVYFWTNENNPLEPIHVHISEGKPVPNATKIWITKDGRCSLANNNSKIPTVILNKLMRVIEARSTEIIEKWESYFNRITFYC
ncbi:MAG: DUF4160 domain-containing protein [Treponema bryantii]|jgi:hypothetical protein|nr:DUF4160 domain-containing protein [Treponema bryantii]